jgi:hypothetical protein
MNHQVYLECTDDLEDDERDEIDQHGAHSFGYGDFIIYNIMLLMISNASWSMTRQICVAIGCSLITQLGLLTTDMFGCFYEVYCIPSVPLPAIFFLTFSILLNRSA